MLKWLLALALVILSPHLALAQQPVVVCWQTESTATPPRTNCTPGLGVVSTTTSASSLVLKSTPGTLLYLDVRNNTAVASQVQVYDATSAPADGGGQTPKLCRPLAASSSVSFNYSAPGLSFVNGIVAVVSVGPDCYTKTTGAADAFFSGAVQ